MIIDSRPLWLAQTNCYVVAPEPGGPCALIDAPPDLPELRKLLDGYGLIPTALLVTHGHIDHVGGAGPVAREFSAVAYLHPDDDWLATDPSAQLQALFGMVPEGDFEPPARFESLADLQVLDIAGVRLRVLHTPGHTPGHVCFHVEEEGVLFSGDQLFAGSIGRTDLPGGDYPTLMRSMTAKVLPLAAETEVLPGHGPATTLARERLTNPFLQELLP